MSRTVYIPPTESSVVTLDYINSHFPSNVTLERTVSFATTAAISQLNASLSSQLSSITAEEKTLVAGLAFDDKQIATVNTSITSLLQSQGQIAINTSNIASLSNAKVVDEGLISSLQTQATVAASSLSTQAASLVSQASSLSSLSAGLSTAQTTINTLSTTLGNVPTLIAVETTRSSNAEQQLALNLTIEISQARIHEGLISAKQIIDEATTTALTNSFSSFQQQVNTAQTVQTAFNTTASTNLQQEVSRAEAQELSLQQEITTLQTNAIQDESSITNLRSLLYSTLASSNAEITRAQLQESALSTLITNETNRSEAVETTLNSSIVQEQSRATMKENTIVASVSTLQSSLTSLANTVAATPASLITTNAQSMYVGLNSGTNVGSYNTSVGYQTLQALSSQGLGTASYNVAMGNQALKACTTGSLNSAVGSFAMNANDIGGSNSAFGSSSLNHNTSGSDCTAIGAYALNLNTTGQQNTAVGSSALKRCVNTSNRCVAVGCNALYQTLSEDNTGVGTNAASSTTFGYQNTVVGSQAFTANLYGSCCTSIGSYSLASNNSDRNIAVGTQAGNTNTTGFDNLYLGFQADGTSNYFNNSIAIGNYAKTTGSNSIQLGNNNISSLKCNVNLYATSDKRFKTNIKEDVPGLAFIERLVPVSYTDNIEAKALFYKTENRDAEQEAVQAKVVHQGYLAQDVQSICDELGFPFDGVHQSKHDDDCYALSYSLFVVPLSKAVQELAQQNRSLISLVASLSSRLDALESSK